MTTVQDHIKALFEVMKDTASIEEVEAGWDHFYPLDSEVERYWSNDPSVMDDLRRVKEGLSTFTDHIRKEAPSPYGGWRPTLGALSTKLRGNFDEKGFPNW